MRRALIVASDAYGDPGLRELRAPKHDAAQLAAVLGDPGIGGFSVRTLHNAAVAETNEAIEDFFADRAPDELLLLYFSGHGVKDETGDLYFATAGTKLNRLAATAVAADFVRQRMNRTRARRVVLLLDCCYAGAFGRGMVARAGTAVALEEQFQGRGRAVITASSAVEYAFEGQEVTDSATGGPSVFTSALVEGLRSGDADRDQDGLVGLDELYEYVYDQVRASTSNQTPGKWVFDLQGDLYIARRGRPVTVPSELPLELREAISHPSRSVRAGVVDDLTRLLTGGHEGLSLAARLALESLSDDDSRSVAAAATSTLAASRPLPPPEQPEPARPDPVDSAPPPATQSEPVQSEPARPHPTRPGLARPESTHPDPAPPPATRPEATRSEATRSKSTQSRSTQPEPARPEHGGHEPDPPEPARQTPARPGHTRQRRALAEIVRLRLAPPKLASGTPPPTAQPRATSVETRTPRSTLVWRAVSAVLAIATAVTLAATPADIALQAMYDRPPRGITILAPTSTTVFGWLLIAAVVGLVVLRGHRRAIAIGAGFGAVAATAAFATRLAALGPVVGPARFYCVGLLGAFLAIVIANAGRRRGWLWEVITSVGVLPVAAVPLLFPRYKDDSGTVVLLGFAVLIGAAIAHLVRTGRAGKPVVRDIAFHALVITIACVGLTLDDVDMTIRLTVAAFSLAAQPLFTDRGSLLPARAGLVATLVLMIPPDVDDMATTLVLTSAAVIAAVVAMWPEPAETRAGAV
ncbi:caspase family protein [Actinokineospora cianjurensis]|uniref:Caspase domain-containing protein n=1 Tax=Actinokineospora cianjurensis TaxID=585224 RepID=A0A421AVD1_9PSEU|nr:caspase family protein [Actinokineospora cianjurensis]RLK53700.1 caspase domain-containing protein [Actinokineospora cianjurensis]